MSILMKAVALATGVVLGVGTVHAATITEEFSVLTTENRLGAPVGFGWEFNLSPSSGLSANFNVDTPGVFTLMDDGTATFSATVFNDDDQSEGFEVFLNFDSIYPNGDDPIFKAAFPGVSDPGNTRFFDPESGTATGFGDLLDGFNFEIGRFPGFDPNNPNPTDPDEQITAFQFGGGVPISSARGVNQHNADFGFSVWLQATSVTSDTCAICGFADFANVAGEQFDIVGNLAPVSTVPLPAGSMLLITGIGALGLARRRRNAS